MKRNKLLYSLLVVTSIFMIVACGKNVVTEVSPTPDTSIDDITEAPSVESSEEPVAEETEEPEEVKVSEEENKVEDKSEDSVDNEENDEKAEENKEEPSEDTLSAENKDETPKEDAEEEVLEEEPKEEIIIPASFDATFYANNNPDVVAAFGNTPEALYNHYLNYGKKEGRAQNAQEQEAKNQAAAIPAPVNDEPASQPDSTSSSTPESSASSDGKTYNVYLDTDMFNMINAYRAECGLPELAWNSAAEQTAKDRILAIAQGGVLSHDAAGGPPEGYRAENLFNGTSGSTEFIFNGYKNSPGHDANLKCNASSCVVATVTVQKEYLGMQMNGGVWNIQIFY